MKRIQSASIRLLLPALALMTITGHAWSAAPIITETPDCFIVELTGQESPARETLPPAPKVEPYLVERIIEHPDYFEVEVIGVPPSPGSQQATPARTAPTYSAPVAAPLREVAASQPQAIVPQRRPEQDVTSSSDYRNGMAQIDALQRELKELQKSDTGESRDMMLERQKKAMLIRKEMSEVTRRMKQLTAEAAGTM